MNLCIRIIDKINNFLINISTVFLVLSCLLAVINALCRKFLSTGFPWAEELCTYLVVMMLFLSLPYLEQKHEHLSINILVSNIKNKVALKIVRLFHGIWTLLIMIIMLRYAIIISINMYQTNIVTYVLRIPRVIFFSNVVIGFALIIVVWACVLIRGGVELE
ncbi:MAG: TRAP transporter small permease [Clostridiales bacterium]|nr:TRAP transporter small permease [Clostridiales bacterium]